MTDPTPPPPPPPPTPPVASLASLPPEVGASSNPAPPPPSAPPNAPVLWFFLFVNAGVWVSIGRYFVGAGGLVGMIMFFTVLPVIGIYAIVLSASISSRCTKRGQVVQPWTARTLITSLVGFAIAGFTIIDGGNMPGSMNSLLTAALHADVEGPVGKASYWISGAAFVLGLVGMVVGLVLVYLEKPRLRPPPPQTASV